MAEHVRGRSQNESCSVRPGGPKNELADVRGHIPKELIFVRPGGPKNRADPCPRTPAKQGRPMPAPVCKTVPAHARAGLQKNLPFRARPGGPGKKFKPAATL